MVSKTKMVDCNLKKNKNKEICKRKNYINVEEYSKREIVDNFVYIPFFFTLVLIFSYLGFVKPEDKTTLITFLIIGAISSTFAFMLSRYMYMRRN